MEVTRPPHRNRAAERVTAVGVLVIVVMLFIGGTFAYVLTKVWGDAVDGVFNVGGQPIVQNALSSTFCADYAGFVLDRSSEGLNEQQIEAVWRAANPKLVDIKDTDVDDRIVPYAGACGTIPDILRAAGR